MPRSRLLLFIGILFASRSFALDVQLFRPSPLSSEGSISYGTMPLGENRWETQLSINWVRNPIEFGVSGARVSDIVDDLVSFNPRISYGLLKNLTLSVDLPIHPFQKIIPPTSTRTESTFSLGDVELSGAWTIIQRNETLHYGLALIPFLTAPTGDEDSFLGAASVTGGLRGAMDFDFSSKDYFNFNIGLRFREKEQIYNLGVGQELFGTIGYRRVLWPSQDFDAFVETYASTSFSNFMSDEISSPIEFYFGFRKGFLRKDLIASIGIGRGLNNGYGAPDIRVFGMVGYRFGGKRPLPPVVEKIVDKGKIAVTVKDETGTPETVSFRMTTAENSVLKETELSTWDDSLAPGVYEFTAKRDDSYEHRGRVTIAANQVTHVDLVLRKKLGNKLEGLGRINFDNDKATLKQDSIPVLDEVVDILKKYPEVRKLRVEAHTDSVASEPYNQNLSQRRAKTVLNYLQEHSIDQSRLTSQGFGESKPIADNKSVEGRAKNRRVEFVILESSTEEVRVVEYGPSR